MTRDLSLRPLAHHSPWLNNRTLLAKHVYQQCLSFCHLAKHKCLLKLAQPNSVYKKLQKLVLLAIFSLYFIDADFFILMQSIDILFVNHAWTRVISLSAKLQ